MATQSAIRFVPRWKIIASRAMNYRRDIRNDADEMLNVINSMATKPARNGDPDTFGWYQNEAIAVCVLSDPKTEKILHEMGYVKQDDPNTQKDESQIPAVQLLIQEEMDFRQSMFGNLTGFELEAFKKMYCDSDGVLLDLRKVSLEELQVQAAGFHRLMFAHLKAYARVLEENSEQMSKSPENRQLKKFTDEIPVIPSTFEDRIDLIMWESTENARGSTTNIAQSLLDMAFIAYEGFPRWRTEGDFRAAMGDAGGYTQRGGTGQSGETKAKKKDAGSRARFAYKIAQLARQFPRLPVMHDIMLGEKHPDFVNLKNLSEKTDDWHSSITLALLFMDLDELAAYKSKYKTENPKVDEMLAGGKPWTLENLQTWWEGRKANKPGNVLQKQLKPTAPSPDQGYIDQWKKTGHSEILRKAMRATYENPKDDHEGSVNFRFFEDNQEILNDLNDVIEKNYFVKEIDEVLKVLMLVRSVDDDKTGVKGDPRPVLKSCVDGLKNLIGDVKRRIEEKAKADQDAIEKAEKERIARESAAPVEKSSKAKAKA